MDDKVPAHKRSAEQLRAASRLYWSKKTVAERLAGMTELNRRLLHLKGIEIDDKTADLTPRRVRRGESWVRPWTEAEELGVLAAIEREWA